MKSARQLISVGLLILVVLASATATAQQGNGGDGGASAENALSELMNTAPVNRASARQAVEELGNQAVQPLIEEVQGYQPGGDTNYVANCILALGNLGDTAATNALLEALQYEDQQVAYQAARALGKIYSQQDGGGRTREVNGALAAMVFRHHPRPLALGAAIALAQINGIVENPTRRELEGDLYPAVTDWMGANPDQLPPLEDQSWPLLLHTFTQGQQSGRRSQAREVLAGNKPLPAVEVIVEILRGKRTDIPDDRWTELAGLLEDITGVSFPSDGSREERLTQWRQQWRRNLKTRTGEDFRNYCWRMLEEKITAVKQNPTQETKEAANTYKEILLNQMESPEQIPDWASETASDLLRRPIELKQRVESALNNVNPDTPAYRKIAELTNVRAVAREDEGPPVVRMFAGQLIELARQEENEDVQAMLSTILTTMSGIPVDLSNENALEEWLQMFREKYPEAADI